MMRSSMARPSAYPDGGGDGRHRVDEHLDDVFRLDQVADVLGDGCHDAPVERRVVDGRRDRATRLGAAVSLPTRSKLCLVLCSFFFWHQGRSREPFCCARNRTFLSNVWTYTLATVLAIWSRPLPRGLLRKR
jgi:hypothetical protein